MNLLSSNQKYCLFSNQDSTFLLETGTFKPVSTLNLGSEIGHLQYGTGIAALVNGSKVRIYDFLFQQDLYEWQNFLKIFKIAIFKNLLVIISSQRILIHDLKTKSSKCYIPIIQGELAFLSHDYYTLKIAYFTDVHMITSRQFWLNRMETIEGVTYTQAAYSHDGKLMALALKNMLSIYAGSKLLRLYGFQSNVEQLVPLGKYFFVKLKNNDILGCGQEKQVNFMEHEEIEVDFWTHDYDTVLIGSQDALYQMGKGIIRKYHLDRAQECNLSDSKNMTKSMSSSQKVIQI